MLNVPLWTILVILVALLACSEPTPATEEAVAAGSVRYNHHHVDEACGYGNYAT